jgi:hypothetical protein
MSGMKDMGVATEVFDALWDGLKYERAVEIYEAAGRPFWLAEEVALYHESMGRFSESMREWEYLLQAYLEIGQDFLPLPDGPEELFLVAQWCSDAEPVKAMRYLSLYLDAEQAWGRDPAFNLRWRDQAQEIMRKLDSGRQRSIGD